MSRNMKRIVAILASLCFFNLACFSSYRISVSELEKLQTTMEAEEVPVIVDGCGGSAALSNGVLVAQEDDVVMDDEPVDEPEDDAPRSEVDPATGCPVIYVSATNAINVYTGGGEDYRVTPFNYTLNETQLVSPDYDLLLDRSTLVGADVELFSTGKTIGLIALLAGIGVGSFLAVSLLAPADRGLGAE